MKTNGILYRGSDNVQSSDRFLSKTELRKLFPTDGWVIMEIIYLRKGYKSHKVAEGKKVRSKKSKKQKFEKSWSPKSYRKSRVVNLF
jgi:hypothetical protein